VSRRHSSSRRRNYGRRQHEVRERRPPTAEPAEWPGAAQVDESRVIDLDADAQSNEAADRRGGNAR
jgi:hypothetical protein